MRILLVTGIFPPDHGGPASYVPRLAEALGRFGHAVEVICLSDSLAHDDAPRGYRVQRIARGRFWPLRLIETALACWRAARRHDLVYINGLGCEAALGAWLAGRPMFCKVVGDHGWERARSKGWFHGTIDEYQTARKGLRLRLLDAVRDFPLRLADEIIVPSRYLRRIVTGWGNAAEKVRVIYNAVDAPPPRTRAVPLLPAWPGRTLVTVCRLVPWKGVDALIRLLPELPETRLVIAGHGVLRADLESLAAASGVAQRVLFLGEMPRAAIPGVLAEADAFVLNSTYEGLPHVVLEAMTAGLPVIATNAGGTGEVVEHEVTGLLVPPGDAGALRDAIARLWREPELGGRLAAEAASRLEERFNFEGMMRATEAALRAVVEPAPPGISVLSFGSTRGLWEGEHAEDFRRMSEYAARLERYIVVVNSYKRHALAARRFAANFEAIPTDAIGPMDSFFRMLWIGAGTLRRCRIDLIQAQDPFFVGLVAVLLGTVFRRPVNVCVYGPNPHDPHWLRSHWSHRLQAPLGRWVLRRSRGIQVDGKRTARSLEGSGYAPERLALKPLVPSNLSLFFAIDRAAANPARTPRILFVGRFAEQKNLPLLIEAAGALREKNVRFELLLAGDGTEFEPIRAQIAREGLAGLVTLRSNVPREGIAEVFAGADVFVLSSNYEGFARVLMEAAAAALPIVTTDVSGAEEAVTDGETGFIVPVGVLHPLVEKLAMLLRDADLRRRMGAAGRARIAATLDPRCNAPAQVAIWQTITGKTSLP